MEEVLPSVPYEERPERFVVFPYNRPSQLWYPGKVLEWGWKKVIHFIGVEYIAEFFGTMIFISFAIGASAQAFFLQNDITNWIGGAWGAAIGILFGLYVSMGVSGGHLNPSISLGLAVVGKFQWWKVPFYWLAQFLGAFMSAVINYLYYFDAMNAFDGGVREFNGQNETYRIWTTNPQPLVSNTNLFWDQFWSTFLLQFLILAIVDRANTGLIDYLRPMGVALIIFSLGVCFSYNCGGAANPIRDFPPRCFAAFLWGPELFRVHDYYFWVPLVAPFLGAPIGAISYVFFIETHNYPASKPFKDTLFASNSGNKIEPSNSDLLPP